MALPFLLLNNEGLSFPAEILKGTEDKKKRREFAVLGRSANTLQRPNRIDLESHNSTF